MSTHPTILGEMIRNETEREEGDETSLDVERDLGIPAGAPKDSPAGARPDLLGGGRPQGQRRERTESE